jgi:hypothetical protein
MSGGNTEAKILLPVLSGSGKKLTRSTEMQDEKFADGD